MFKVIDSKDNIVTVQMDEETFAELEAGMKEDIHSYEFVFDTPTSASLLTK